MLAVNKNEFYAKANIISNHGRIPQKHAHFWMDELGLKYKMSNFQAALGCSQLKRIDTIVERKRKLISKYQNLLRLLKIEASLLIEDELTYSSYWLPVLRFNREVDTTSLVSSANKEGIGLRPFFHPLTQMPMFAKFEKDDEKAKCLSSSCINLPSYEEMSCDEVEIVLTYISKFIS